MYTYYAFMYVFMYACMCGWVCVCACVCVYVCVYACMHKCIHIYKRLVVPIVAVYMRRGGKIEGQRLKVKQQHPSFSPPRPERDPPPLLPPRMARMAGGKMRL